MVFDKYWFRENQRPIVALLNSPIGGLIRRGLWIEERSPIVGITPESVHALLPDGKIRTTIYSNKQYAEAMHRNFRPIWETLHFWDMQFANRFAPAFNAGFDTYTSQPDDTSGVDTFINSGLPSNNFGTDVELGIGERNDSAAVTRTLIKFDLSSIPSTNTVSAGTLSLFVSRDLSSNARSASVYRALRAWNESQCDWTHYDTSLTWTTAGAGSDGNDADLSTAWATTSFTASESASTQKDFSLSTTELQKFINGTYTNRGWLIKMATETDDTYYMHSSSAVTSSLRPKLVITHAAPASGGFLMFF